MDFKLFVVLMTVIICGSILGFTYMVLKVAEKSNNAGKKSEVSR